MNITQNHRTVLTGIAGGIIGAFAVFAVMAGLVISYPEQTRSLILGAGSFDADRGTSVAAEADRALTDREQLVIDAAEKVKPAVVAVTLTKDVPTYERSYGGEYEDPFERFFGIPSPFGDLFERDVPVLREQGTERVEVGGGTGFLISEDGYIVTNRHVVDAEDVEYSVVTDDGESHDAEIIAKDPVYDIAILKIEGSNYPFLTFGDSDAIRVGQTAIAVGNALSEFRNTVSVGVISGLLRSITAGDGRGSVERLEGVIQTDAAINPGNSGGPLLDLSGKIIGVNVAMAGAENIGFALPSNAVKKVADSVRENGKIVRPFLGVRYMEITENLKRKNKLPMDEGVLVIRGDARGELAVTPGSAADKAGIEENDIILELDGTKIDENHSLASLIREKNVGDTVELKILHKGEEKIVRATLGAYPE
jgi:serine protease Do